MTDHSAAFESAPSGLKLTNAVLLYRAPRNELSPRERGAAFASMHDVETVEGRPVIAGGAPLTREQLRKWTEALGRNAAPEILPDNVLVRHPDMLAWWVPEKVRPSYFNLTRPPEGLKAIAEKHTTLSLPYPAHLFIATRSSLGVYALPESKRPTADTVILFSPVLNVFINGSLCWGNVPRPKTIGTAAMIEFERAVFDSWSTHPNAGQELTVTGKGGLVRLWDELAARKATRFPVKRLKPFRFTGRDAGSEPVTLAKLIAEAARS